MEWIESFHDLIGREGGDVTWWQMTVRGVLVFFYGLVLVRVAGQRIFGKLAAFDIVLAVLIGSNLSRTLTTNAPFLPTLAATGRIVALHWSITKLALRSKTIGWLVKGEVVQLVQDGRAWTAISHEESPCCRGAPEAEAVSSDVKGYCCCTVLWNSSS